MHFVDRVDAGRRLATALHSLADDDVVVLGLPRGGVPVAAEIAAALHAPLDVIIVRKLGVPVQPELGMGAVGEGGVLIVNDDLVRRARVSDGELARVEERERAELERRLERLRGGRPPVPLQGRTVVIVDDGIATGSTARAACQVARARGAMRVVLAAPVAPAGIDADLRPDADEVVCLGTPASFVAIGQFYDDFTQVTDAEVLTLLHRAEAPVAADPPAPRDDDVIVVADGRRLQGRLTVPTGCVGTVVFAHGSGSSRHSPRNRAVAATLNAAGFATLLLDLLTPDEESERATVFDIDLLAGRVSAALRWLRSQPGLARLPVGLFGASTGAAAALRAAAHPEARVAAVVSRGGRPDLAGPSLGAVRSPTLLIVGGADDVVLALNREAQTRLRAENRLEVVSGASHLFEEPGALDAVASLAARWFRDHV